MKTRKTINKNWSAYDQTVAKCHLDNWGVIYLDEYNQPMDVEDVYYMMEDEA